MAGRQLLPVVPRPPWGCGGNEWVVGPSPRSVMVTIASTLPTGWPWVMVKVRAWVARLQTGQTVSSTVTNG